MEMCTCDAHLSSVNMEITLHRVYFASLAFVRIPLSLKEESVRALTSKGWTSVRRQRGDVTIRSIGRPGNETEPTTTTADAATK